MSAGRFLSDPASTVGKRTLMSIWADSPPQCTIVNSRFIDCSFSWRPRTHFRCLPSPIHDNAVTVRIGVGNNEAPWVAEESDDQLLENVVISRGRF
jgi:hypothetical protein